MAYQILSLLFVLNLAHFLGDFTPLNQWFIAAKKYGKPVWLVACHGAVNGALYGIAAGLFAGMKAALLAFATETVTHTIIDVLKGRINKRFPVVEDTGKPVHWMVMGADQFLHQVVLIFIVSLCFK